MVTNWLNASSGGTFSIFLVQQRLPHAAPHYKDWLASSHHPKVLALKSK